MNNITVAVVYHSGYGHTKKLAESIASGVSQAGANAELVSVENVEDVNWQLLSEADALVFGSPTYMGSVSAQFKGFMDASSKIWAEQGWKDKLAAGFTNSASMSGDKLNTLIQLSVFAAQHGMNWVSHGQMPGNNSTTGSAEDINRVGSYLGMMAQSNADQGPELAPPSADLRTAILFGERVANAAVRWS